MNLLGSPFSVTHMVQEAFPSKQVVEAAQYLLAVMLTLKRGQQWLQAEILHAIANEPITLNLVTNIPVPVAVVCDPEVKS